MIAIREPMQVHRYSVPLTLGSLVAGEGLVLFLPSIVQPVKCGAGEYVL